METETLLGVENLGDADNGLGSVSSSGGNLQSAAQNANATATSGIEGLSPITVESKDEILDALKMTDKLDALYKRGCSSAEFIAAATPMAASTRPVGAGTLIATSGEQNTATGAGALLSNSTGFRNTANGVFALFNNTAGFSDTASGAFALFNNTTGGTNTANGESALYINSTGDGNTATGWSALCNNTAGSSNTAAGYQALFFNDTGDNNTAVGVAALVSSTTGSNNTALGYGAGSNIFAADNVICIGANVAGVDVSDTCFIGNIRDVTTQNGDAIGVVIDSAGQLGTISSSARFKKEIKPMDKASEAVLALRPVTFRCKSDKTNTPQFGLIAEEVAKVNPELVVRNKDGKIYTVRYEAVNAMLLNEFLKEHRRNEEQEATIAELKKELQATAAHQQKQIEALTAGLQKVSAQLEASRPAPQVVNNP